MPEKKRKPKTESPLSERVRLVRARPARLGSALTQMKISFNPKESVDTFVRWRNLPETLLFIDALREMAENPPPAYIAQEDIGVQYGVSSGLGLAAAFLGDPSVLFNELFTGSTLGNPADASPEPDYTAAGDDPGR